VSAAPGSAATDPIDIAPNDPIVAYLQTTSGSVDIQELHMDSPALRDMKAAGIRLAVPLVSQGELIGILNLGPRLSQQEYSSDDRSLLNNLASQATPALRVAQLVRQQQEEAEERQRIEQELQVARLIQHTLLPKSLPQVDGWHLAAHYRPARAVGGDFYDFIQLNDGRLGLVVGDVTDKGVPAALVMATTRSVLRAAASNSSDPGAVLRRVNTMLCPDIPPNMFVTCLFAVLNPVNGHLVYANAGHDAPYQRTQHGVEELRARGMPLGLMPDMEYEEMETQLAPGDAVLFYSDGLVEAHNAHREMFSFPRLRDLMAHHDMSTTEELVDFLLGQLAQFTGPDWEQEDDITLVTLARVRNVARLTSFATDMLDQDQEVEDDHSGSDEGLSMQGGGERWKTLIEFSVPSAPGNERGAMERVQDAVKPLGLHTRTVEKLGTAVSEATMNAMEHGNKYQPELLVALRVEVSSKSVRVGITDQGDPIPLNSEEPDLELKLAGMQTPRGWGMFLIKNMVDDMRVADDESGHTLELTIHREGANRVE
jgi:serine phosphatase RsbU (regulator of sigma subunit)/anti-sigma regulatory factor (Ser/Thr protein kinase)